MYQFIITITLLGNAEPYFHLESRPMPEAVCVDKLADEASYWGELFKGDREAQIRLRCIPHVVSA